MKTYWVLCSKYYDDGSIYFSAKKVAVLEKPKNNFEKFMFGKIFFDYFDNKSELDDYCSLLFANIKLDKNGKFIKKKEF